VYCFFVTKQWFAQSIGHTALHIVRLMQKLQHNLKQTSTQATNIYWFICHKGERP